MHLFKHISGFSLLNHQSQISEEAPFPQLVKEPLSEYTPKSNIHGHVGLLDWPSAAALVAVF